MRRWGRVAEDPPYREPEPWLEVWVEWNFGKVRPGAMSIRVINESGTASIYTRLLYPLRV